MPIHEYACHGCGHEFERLVRSSDVPDCPQCGGTDLHRKLSVPSQGRLYYMRYALKMGYTVEQVSQYTRIDAAALAKAQKTTP